MKAVPALPVHSGVRVRSVECGACVQDAFNLLYTVGATALRGATNTLHGCAATQLQPPSGELEVDSEGDKLRRQYSPLEGGKIAP